MKSIEIGDEIIVKDLSNGEISKYTIYYPTNKVYVPLFGNHYEGYYKTKTVCFSDPIIEGTISYNSPLVKAIRDLNKKGTNFFLKVDGIITQYQLLKVIGKD